MLIKLADLILIRKAKMITMTLTPIPTITKFIISRNRKWLTKSETIICNLKKSTLKI